MITNAVAMGCGGCGHRSFRMYSAANEEYPPSLYAECEGCEAVSIIAPTPVHVQIDWAPGNDKGVLARAPD